MSQYFSPKDVASAVGASESSLKRWIDKGLLRAVKTAGGHRRLPLDAVLEYLRHSGRALENPTAISLPEGCGLQRPGSTETSREAMVSALVAGDEVTARRLVLDQFISGMSIAEISDDLISPVFRQVGDLWECGEVQVYEERRACELCQRVVHELRRAIGEGPASGPIAMGGTLDGDPYTLSTSLAELVLRENGWQATSLGNMLPFETIRNAIFDRSPGLLWVSVNSIRDNDRFSAEFNILFDVAQSSGTVLVVGGHAMSADLRQRIRCPNVFSDLRQLEAFACGLGDPPARVSNLVQSEN